MIDFDRLGASVAYFKFWQGNRSHTHGHDSMTVDNPETIVTLKFHMSKHKAQ